MVKFTTKDMLRGMTLAAVGFGMIAVVANNTIETGMIWQSQLVTFGGMLIGYGFAFPFKWPPTQMILALTGMFAAMAWQSGIYSGLYMFLGTIAIYFVVQYSLSRWKA